MAIFGRMHRRAFVALALLVSVNLLNHPVYSATPEPSFTVVDAYIESEMRAAHIPGVALAITRGEQVAYLR